MTPPGPAPGLIETPLTKGRADVLFVSLGTTIGLQVADDQFVRALRGAGLTVEVARPAPVGRRIRTMMLTDFVQAWVCGAAARQLSHRIDFSVVVYSTTTAALFGPEPGAIRFDALAQRTRPGRHGLWQRPLERRRLRRAWALFPWDAESLAGAPEGLDAPTRVVPVAIEPPSDAEAARAAAQLLAAWTADGASVSAVTYAADAHKKGLDRLVAAWGHAARDGETLIVTGRDALPPELREAAGDRVRCVGRLDPDVFRAVVGAVGLLAIAPRREDYGLVQLEALAAGARVVTTTAPGPYAALPLIRGLWPEGVVDDADDSAALAAALRQAIDANAATPSADDPTRAAARDVVAPFSAEAVAAQIARDVIPLLITQPSKPA